MYLVMLSVYWINWAIHSKKKDSHAHSPTFPSLHLRHSSFSNPSIALPTSQLILQPFRRFTYVISHSPILPLLHLHHSSFCNPSFASPTSQALHLRHLASRPCSSVKLWITELVWLLKISYLQRMATEALLVALCKEVSTRCTHSRVAWSSVLNARSKQTIALCSMSQRELVHRLHKCIDANGGHIDHLL